MPLSFPPLHSLCTLHVFFWPLRVHHQLTLPFLISLGNNMFSARFERNQVPKNKALTTEPLLEIDGVTLPALNDDSSFHEKGRLSRLRRTFNVFLSRPHLPSSTPQKTSRSSSEVLSLFPPPILAGLKCGPLNYLSFCSDHPIYLGLLQWIYCLVFFQA